MLCGKCGHENTCVSHLIGDESGIGAVNVCGDVNECFCVSVERCLSQSEGSFVEVCRACTPHSTTEMQVYSHVPQWPPISFKLLPFLICILPEGQQILTYIVKSLPVNQLNLFRYDCILDTIKTLVVLKY